MDDIGRTRPEALFVDTDFLDCDPADAVSAMRAVLPGALICAYTDGEGASRADRLRYAGADCVLSKRSGQHEIAEGVRVARETGGYTDPRFVLAAEPSGSAGRRGPGRRPAPPLPRRRRAPARPSSAPQRRGQKPQRRGAGQARAQAVDLVEGVVRPRQFERDDAHAGGAQPGREGALEGRPHQLVAVADDQQRGRLAGPHVRQRRGGLVRRAVRADRAVRPGTRLRMLRTPAGSGRGGSA